MDVTVQCVKVIFIFRITKYAFCIVIFKYVFNNVLNSLGFDENVYLILLFLRTFNLKDFSIVSVLILKIQVLVLHLRERN